MPLHRTIFQKKNNFQNKNPPPTPYVYATRTYVHLGSHTTARTLCLINICLSNRRLIIVLFVLVRTYVHPATSIHPNLKHNNLSQLEPRGTSQLQPASTSMNCLAPCMFSNCPPVPCIVRLPCLHGGTTEFLRLFLPCSRATSIELHGYQCLYYYLRLCLLLIIMDNSVTSSVIDVRQHHTSWPLPFEHPSTLYTSQT